MKHLFSIFSLLFISYGAFAQDFQYGTIVFEEGDSLDCEFQFQFSWKEEPFLNYINPDNGEITELQAADLVAFGNLEEGYWYISRELKIETDRREDTRWLFLESIILGRVSLYKVKDSKLSEHFYIENSSGKINELVNRSYEELDAAKITRTRYDYAYLVTLQQSLMGCMEIVKNVKDYAFTEGALTQAVIDYHHCLEAPYLKMIAPPSPIKLPQIGLRLALSSPFITTLPTATGKNSGWEAGLSIRWPMPRTKEQFVLQIDGVYHRSWGLAQVRDQLFLSEISTIRISPLVQQQFRWSNHTVFINFGYDLLLFGQDTELEYPYFENQGYLRWESIPKHFFGGAGYIFEDQNGHLYQIETRIRFRQFLILSLGTSFYW